LLGQVAAATTGELVLNRDDERIAALAGRTSATVSYYGVAAALRPSFPTDEELYGGAVEISTTPAAAELLSLPTTQTPTTTLRVGAASIEVRLRAEGPHNAQNAAGAAAVALSFGLDAATVAAGLTKVEPAFGRGQSFTVDGRRVVLQLVKNPAGFRQSLHTLDVGAAADVIDIVINDDYADGRDVSWLWDVDFTPLVERSARLVTAGTRATDMAVRLHYDGAEVAEIEPDLEKSLRSAVAAAPADGLVVVFSTYTAMWALHTILLRIGVTT
jgi:UDP-N-acetylmuramyl tripeptide synthase